MHLKVLFFYFLSLKRILENLVLIWLADLVHHFDRQNGQTESKLTEIRFTKRYFAADTRSANFWLQLVALRFPIYLVTAQICHPVKTVVQNCCFQRLCLKKCCPVQVKDICCIGNLYPSTNQRHVFKYVFIQSRTHKAGPVSIHYAAIVSVREWKNIKSKWLDFTHFSTNC